MIKLVICARPVLLVLVGCGATHASQLQSDREECLGFGFKPGTDRYSDCLLTLDARRHRASHRH